MEIFYEDKEEETVWLRKEKKARQRKKTVWLK